MPPCSRPARARDGGSAAAELVLVTPLLLIMLMLIVAAGRLVLARSQVDGAAAQAARAASLAADAAAAGPAAGAAARAALAGDAITCSQLTVTADTTDFTPGGQVSVTVSCTVSLSGLLLLRLPGSETLTAAAAAPIDEFRTVAPAPQTGGSGP
jgi:Flp pilus assembly protein TadG